MIDQLKRLRSLLEGKTILKIEEPNAPEAICRFVLVDGSVFRLHATDLGFWVEGTANDSGLYDNLTDLLVDYSNHVRAFESIKNREIDDHFNYDVPEGMYYEAPSAAVFVDEKLCKFLAPDGKEFIGNLNSFTNYENNILASSGGIKLISEAAILGNAWTILFSSNNENCPRELRYIPGNE